MRLIFKKYKTITEDEKQIILKWRNQARVRTKMVSQKLITFQEHLEWLKALTKRNDIDYYLVYCDDVPVGEASYSDIDLKHKQAQPGLYIGETKYLSIGIPVNFYMLDYYINQLGYNKLYAYILSNNKRVYDMHIKIFKAIDESYIDNYANGLGAYKIYWTKELWNFERKNIAEILESYEINEIVWR